MGEHPIENLMITAMNSIQNMVDVNTIVGEPIQSMNGITIIPISKVSFGFAAGGSEFTGETIKQYRMKDKDEEIEYKLPFGGGAGAGVSINPVAFLVVQGDNVKLMPVDHQSCIDRLIDYVPDLMQKINEMFNKSICQKDERTKRYYISCFSNNNNSNVNIGCSNSNTCKPKWRIIPNSKKCSKWHTKCC